MLQLEIKGRTVQVQCGMRFLKELNKKFTMNVQGVDIGFGLRRVLIDIEVGDVTILSDLIEAGTRNTKTGYKPTTEDIEEYLDTIEDYETLMEQFELEIKESNATKKQYQEIQEEGQAEMDRLQKIEDLKTGETNTNE